MKAVLLIVFAFCFLGGISQPNVPFNLLNYQQFGKPVVASGKRPLDAKYKYYDPANFVTRAYKDTTEVRLVLPLNQRDQGQKVLVNTGGTLLNGVITGGTNADWWYKDGTADNNLIPFGGNSVTGGFGILGTTTFLVDTGSAIAGRLRLVNELALKQPLEDQRLSKSNSPIFNRVISSSAANIDAFQISNDYDHYSGIRWFNGPNTVAAISYIGKNAGLGKRNNKLEINMDSSRAFTIGSSGNVEMEVSPGLVGIKSGRVSVGTYAIAHGHSILNGYGVPSDSSYREKLSKAKGWDTIYNRAINGSCVADGAFYIYQEFPTPFKQFIYDFNANDSRTHSNPIQFDYYRHGLMDEVAYLGMDTSKRVGGSDARTVKTGTWTTTGIYGGLTTGSIQVGATLTYKTSGTDVFIGTIKQNGNLGTFSIAIDGTVIDTISHPDINVASVNGATYAPYLLHYANLYDSSHTVTVKVVTCANTSTDRIYVTWIGGNGGGAKSQQPPVVYVNDGNRQTAAGYLANGGSDALVAQYNNEIYAAVDELASAGIAVVQVRGGSSLNPLTDLTDGLHPNSAGHAKELAEFLYASNNLLYSIDRQRAAKVPRVDNVSANRYLVMRDSHGNETMSNSLFGTNLATTGYVDTLVNYFVVTDATSGALVLSQARKTKAIVDPAGFLSTKSLTLPVGTSKSFEVLILFGGQLGYGADVVGVFTLNVAGGNVLYAPTTFYNLKGGDAIRVDFHAGNVTYRRIIL